MMNTGYVFSNPTSTLMIPLAQTIAQLCRGSGGKVLSDICSKTIEVARSDELKIGAKDDKRVLPYMGILIVLLFGEAAAEGNDVKGFMEYLVNQDISSLPTSTTPVVTHIRTKSNDQIKLILSSKLLSNLLVLIFEK